MIEYVLLASLVSLATTAALGRVANSVKTAYVNIGTTVVSFTSQLGTSGKGNGGNNGNGNGNGNGNSGGGNGNGNGNGNGGGGNGKG